MNNKKLVVTRVVMTVLTVLSVVFIFCNSLLNADLSDEESGAVMDFLNWLFCSLNIDIVLNGFIVRKLAHFTEFALLGALSAVTARLYVRGRLRFSAIALGIGACVAVCDELIQTISEGRSCSVRDMLIDFSGVTAAVLAVVLIVTLIDKKKQGKVKE